MANVLSMDFAFYGREADFHNLEFYDAATALEGFQRSLALTTHLILTGQIITQAPALKGARIYIAPPQVGSWKITAHVVTGIVAGYYLVTAPKETVLGSLIGSAYDYVIHETLGFHVDYSKTLGQQLEEYHKSHPQTVPRIPESKIDSLIEKCEAPIKQMHRPITASGSAQSAQLFRHGRPIDAVLTRQTFDYIDYTERSLQSLLIEGSVTSYNLNTYKGRLFIEAEQRPVPFVLADTARARSDIRQLTESLSAHGQNRAEGRILVEAFKYNSRSGRLKKLLIMNIQRRPLDEYTRLLGLST